MTNSIQKRKIYIAALIFCIIIGFYYWYSEKLPYNNGFGWDGAVYAGIVKNFETDIASGKIDGYYIRRILPAIIVGLPSRIFDIPVTSSYIVKGFVVADIINIILSTIFWLRIVFLLNLSATRILAGSILMFLSYPVMKYYAYYPVLTDSFVLSTSLAMLYYYLKENTFKLVLTIVAASFMWSTTTYLGLSLLLFPRNSKLQIPVHLRRRLSHMVSWGAMGVVALFISKVIYRMYVAHDYNLTLLKTSPERVELLPISIVLVLAYVYWCGHSGVAALEVSEKGRFVLSGTEFKTVVRTVVVIGAISAVQAWLAGKPHPGTMTTSAQIKFIAWSSIKLPLLFLISSATYYGATMILLFLNLKEVLRKSHELGFGILLVISTGLALGLSAEPRFLTNIFPFMVLVVVLSGMFERLGALQWGLLIAIQLVASKLWLTIGASAADFDGSLQAYPAQRLFMSLGVWMSDLNALYHFIAAVVATVALWYVKRKCVQGGIDSTDLGERPAR